VDIDGKPALPHKDLRQEAPALAACLQEKPALDPDLARVVNAWPKLPEAIRAAMLAMVASATTAHKAR
jgi:hypothetical protein